jgi:hypothetical protein
MSCPNNKEQKQIKISQSSPGNGDVALMLSGLICVRQPQKKKRLGAKLFISPRMCLQENLKK